MEKNRKLELFTGIVDEFNLSVNDVVSYWVNSGRLNLDAATVSSQAVPSGKYKMPLRVMPGMYVYADGLIYPEIIEGRQIKAIVGSVNGSDVLAVCLQEARFRWSSVFLEAEATQKMTGGKEATCEILEISRKKQQVAEAVQWCYDYDKDGVKGEAFLPSITELERLYANIVAINASLKALGVALLVGCYWSSTESHKDSYSARILNMSNGNAISSTNKYDNNPYVRPVIALSVPWKYETPKGVMPGMYVYADGLIYPEIIEGRQIKAIVGSVNGSDVLAVCLIDCLHEVHFQWSSDFLQAKATQKMTDGQEATSKILEIACEKGQRAEAAQKCYDYAESGVEKGEAFLPSITELEKLFANKAAINASLYELGVALLKGWYWSSTETEDDSNCARVFNMSDGNATYCSNKFNKNPVCPVIAIKL